MSKRKRQKMRIKKEIDKRKKKGINEDEKKNICLEKNFFKWMKEIWKTKEKDRKKGNELWKHLHKLKLTNYQEIWLVDLI